MERPGLTVSPARVAQNNKCTQGDCSRLLPPFRSDHTNVGVQHGGLAAKPCMAVNRQVGHRRRCGRDRQNSGLQAPAPCSRRSRCKSVRGVPRPTIVQRQDDCHGSAIGRWSKCTMDVVPARLGYDASSRQRQSVSLWRTSDEGTSAKQDSCPDRTEAEPGGKYIQRGHHRQNVTRGCLTFRCCRSRATAAAALRDPKTVIFATFQVV
jgi:hypothetical protein